MCPGIWRSGLVDRFVLVAREERVARRFPHAGRALIRLHLNLNGSALGTHDQPTSPLTTPTIHISGYALIGIRIPTGRVTSPT